MENRRHNVHSEGNAAQRHIDFVRSLRYAPAGPPKRGYRRVDQREGDIVLFKATPPPRAHPRRTPPTRLLVPKGMLCGCSPGANHRHIATCRGSCTFPQGSQMWHTRKAPAGTMLLYFKLNFRGLMAGGGGRAAAGNVTPSGHPAPPAIQ